MDILLLATTAQSDEYVLSDGNEYFFVSLFARGVDGGEYSPTNE